MKQRLIKTVLVDDELHCTASLAISLQELAQNISVINSFNKPAEAYLYLKQNPDFDLLFLDIEMPGINGFDLLKKLTNIPFDVVFVTAYNQYAINAFKYSAFDYLLKPIDEKDLQLCINRWQQKQQSGVEKKQLDFLESLLTRDRQPDKLALPTHDGLEFVKIDEIIRCQSDSNYTYFHFTNSSELLICRTLKDVENALTPHGFIRIHQSHLVNPKYIKKLVKNDGGYLVMTDESHLRISKSKKQLIINIFNSIS